MDFTILTENFDVVTMVACLVVGYIIKHASIFKKVPNCDIPVLLALIGAVVHPLVVGFTVENFIFGGLMGLASTGFHQAFKRFVENDKTE